MIVETELNSGRTPALVARHTQQSGGGLITEFENHGKKRGGEVAGNYRVDIMTRRRAGGV